MNIEELKEQIVNKFDETSLLDFLEIDMWELVEILEEQIKEKRVEFEEVCKN